MVEVDMLAAISRPRLLSWVQGAGRWPGTLLPSSKSEENSARVQEREPLEEAWSQSGGQRRSAGAPLTWSWSHWSVMAPPSTTWQNLLRTTVSQEMRSNAVLHCTVLCGEGVTCAGRWQSSCRPCSWSCRSPPPGSQRADPRAGDTEVNNEKFYLLKINILNGAFL